MAHFNPNFPKIEVSSYTEAKAYIDERFRQALEPVSSSSLSYKGYFCPICDNGEGENGTGMTENPKSAGHYTCFRCNSYQNASGIDIIALLYGQESSPDGEKLKLAMQVLGIEYAKNKSRAKTATKPTAPESKASTKAQPNKAQSTKTQLADNTAAYQTWHTALFSPEGTAALAYLHSRGLTDDLINRYNIGFARGWVHPSAKSKVKSDRVIIPRTPYTYLARAIDDRNTVQKLIVGTQSELFLATADLSSSIQVIVEGEIDAILCRECIKESIIGLGGISNAGTLVQMFEKRKAEGTLDPKTVCLLMLDNDEAGRETQKKLADALSPLVRVLSAPVNQVYRGAKDIGEAYKDKENLQYRISLQLVSAYQYFRTASDNTEGYSNEPEPPVLEAEGYKEPLTSPQNNATLVSSARVEPTKETLIEKILRVCGSCEALRADASRPADELEEPSREFITHCANCRELYKAELAYPLLVRFLYRGTTALTPLNQVQEAPTPPPIPQQEPTEKPQTTFKGKGKTATMERRHGKAIETLYREGRKPRDIAKTLGISHQSVYSYLKKKGIR